ncbi:hypothetical protein [Lactococcus allomyrinae]|uniref:Uncharacterized protein n=1 Tax=Lactococcus allomyrinae TaxID=2419773 RepID=A0A387BCB2_9LACT|nr:hypothetical protein [Lactococcus allomyrinae]AYG01443.1 hypothetical protein D7I46_10400 [Lactococcus allomyrinae]
MTNFKIFAVSTALVTATLGSFALSPTNVQADDIQNTATELVKEQISEQFSNFDQNEKVVALPLGGYVQGEAKIGDLVNGKIDESSWVTIDSTTSLNAITVTQAEKVAFDKYETALAAQNNPFQVFGATPPASSKVLNVAGTSYTSDYFSDAGTNTWRYGGYWIGDDENGTLCALDWLTYNGPGRIGTLTQVSNMTSGILDGTKITSSSTYYRSHTGQPMLYFTNVTNAFYYVKGTGKL